MLVLIDLATGIFNALSQSPSPALIILERSVWSNGPTFAEINLETTDKIAFDYAWRRLIDSSPLNELDVRFIHLRADIDTLVARIRLRARTSEAGISRKYLEKISDAHEKWLHEANRTHKVVHLDATRSESEVCEDACQVIRKWAMQASDQFNDSSTGH